MQPTEQKTGLGLKSLTVILIVLVVAAAAACSPVPMISLFRSALR